MVAICTYQRNDDLVVLLRALLVCADRVRHSASVGVVVVDDTSHGGAREVARSFEDQFELGLKYDISGQQNISLARNLAIETAMLGGDYVAMTDDDCEPPAEWLSELLLAQQSTGADCVTGRMIRRAPPGSPKWLTEEPFFDLGVEQPADGQEIQAGATFNSMIRSKWLLDNPAIRFDPAFGKIGGEDMVFFRLAHSEGLRICFAANAFVYENESPARSTLSYQLFIYFWHGNSAYISGVRSGIPRSRMVIHGLASFGRALARPIGRLVRGRSPQLRFGLAKLLHAMGQLVGPLGVRIKHR